MSKKKVNIIKNSIFIILIVALIIIFRNQLYDAMLEMRHTSVLALVAAVVLSLTYQFVEGINMKEFTTINGYKVPLWNSFVIALYTAFIRLASFGGASAVGTIYYLQDYDVPLSVSTSISMLQFMIQKITIGILAIFFFIVQYSMFSAYYQEYFIYLPTALGILILICLGFLIISGSSKVHHVLLRFLSWTDRKHKYQKGIEDISNKLNDLRTASYTIIKHPYSILKIIIRNCFKYICIFTIPYFILKDYISISYIELIGIMSLMNAIASVLPTPGGIGSSEFVFVAMFSHLAETEILLSCALLYRFFTYAFPGIVGGVLVGIRRFKEE